MKRSIQTILGGLLFTISCYVYAFQPQVDQYVWIDMPAINVDDDAYAEGKVIEIVNDTQTKVLIQSITKTKAFTSGISCVLNTNEDVVWQTPDILRTQKIEVISNQQLYPRDVGYNRYYERQNWLLSFLKWEDRHPVIERERFSESKRIALERDMQDLAAINDLMIMEYDAYQGAHFNIYPIPQRIHNLLSVLTHLQQLLTQQPDLHALWKARKRDFSEHNSDSYAYFAVLAIDKILEDAQKSRGLLNKQLADSSDAQQFDRLIQQFERDD